MSLFQDAKEILDNGNNKQVKSIKNSNGNIIWGSQSAFPYRRLEYIHFNGAEYINTNKTVPGNTNYKRIDMYCKYLDLSDWTGSGYYSSTNNKLMLGTNASGKTQFAVGSQYVYNSADLISLDTNNYYFWLLWSNNGNTSLALYQNPDETGQVGVTNTYSYSFNTASGNLYIGAYLDGRSSTLAGHCKMDLKTFSIRTGSYGNAIFNGIPCQRKSDNVCGMYDIVTSTFYPMEGTSVTSGAAGPVVDEYWDLTA